MRRSITRTTLSLAAIITLTILSLACNVCGLTGLTEIDSEPQAGEWSGSLSYPTSEGQDVTWNLSFTVTENRKQINHFAFTRYYGEPAPDTKEAWMMSLQPADVEDNSFSISFTETRGYMMYTHMFKGTFTSPSEAVGTLTTEGETYEWTAAPVEP